MGIELLGQLKNKKTKGKKDKKTKRQKDKIEFKIGMSGQFHTLAMILCNCIHGAIACNKSKLIAMNATYNLIKFNAFDKHEETMLPCPG